MTVSKYDLFNDDEMPIAFHISDKGRVMKDAGKRENRIQNASCQLADCGSSVADIFQACWFTTRVAKCFSTINIGRSFFRVCCTLVANGGEQLKPTLALGNESD